MGRNAKNAFKLVRDIAGERVLAAYEGDERVLGTTKPDGEFRHCHADRREFFLD